MPVLKMQVLMFGLYFINGVPFKQTACVDILLRSSMHFQLPIRVITFRSNKRLVF
ncbi:hypothetical protein SEVIR_3G322603v4 [Setaria viridis]|uniref:Uncharacterized protein n=1 Tax=Setaria viridis TaxID=4556 RepID=A0A4U6VJA6_SETVI|nr:hypothetical protein SEVIR_3G322603v2 [Setaria viridis]